MRRSSDFPTKAENKPVMPLNNLPIIVVIKIIPQSAVTFPPLTQPSLQLSPRLGGDERNGRGTGEASHARPKRAEQSGTGRAGVAAAALGAREHAGLRAAVRGREVRELRGQGGAGGAGPAPSGGAGGRAVREARPGLRAA